MDGHSRMLETIVGLGGVAVTALASVLSYFAGRRGRVAQENATHVEAAGAAVTTMLETMHRMEDEIESLRAQTQALSHHVYRLEEALVANGLEVPTRPPAMGGWPPPPVV